MDNKLKHFTKITNKHEKKSQNYLFFVSIENTMTLR